MCHAEDSSNLREFFKRAGLARDVSAGGGVEEAAAITLAIALAITLASSLAAHGMFHFVINTFIAEITIRNHFRKLSSLSCVVSYKCLNAETYIRNRCCKPSRLSWYVSIIHR